MPFEITNCEEYVALKTCISLYEMMSWIVKENEDKIVEQTFKTFFKNEK